MKIFKFIRVLLHRGWRWLIVNEFFEAMFGFLCLLSGISFVMLVLGCIAYAIGIQTANNNIIECGSALLSILIIAGLLCCALWNCCKFIIRMFCYLRNVWREL